MRTGVLWAAVAAAAVVGLPAASATSSGWLPAEGSWEYDNTKTLRVATGTAEFRGLAYIWAGSRRSGFVEVDGWVNGGICKSKSGAAVKGSVVPFHLNGYTKFVVAIKRDGTFSASKHSDGDVSSGATFTLKGVVRGKHVTGTVTAHTPHDAVYGDCKATGKFSRAKGIKIA